MARTIEANGIELCTETFGDPNDPALLIITGSSTSGVSGGDPMSDLLVAGGRYVIRYDARDTGKSTRFDFATHPYTLTDMANDAIGLLDALGVDRADVFGGSMGGMVAQEVAIGHPDRVRSLILFMSTPAVTDAESGSWTGGLPPMSPKLLDLFSSRTFPLETREDRRQLAVDMFRVLAGSRYEFDEGFVRAFFDLQDAHSGGVPSSNHDAAITASRDRVELLASVTAPTLVIHGTEDPIIPYEHGVALAKAIPDARLHTVEGLGHELPGPFIPELVEAILDHVR